MNTAFHVRRLAIAMVCLLGFGAIAAAQQDGLDGAEGRMLVALMDRFKPLPSVERIWTGAFISASNKVAVIKDHIDSLERSGLPEEEVLVLVGALQQEMRVVKQDRNSFVAGFLSPLDQLSLDSILNPPAPSIQHFGFHDRLKCLVCKAPGEGAIFPSGVKSPDQLLIPKQ